MSDPRVRAALRAREGLRKGSERAGLRVTRGLGEPALFAVTLSAVVASMFFALGVVAGDALGLTPLVYLIAAIFFAVTMATYVEGTSLHIERGGASTLARYAFDELWSFIAGWAILLDYLIVMAAGAIVISDYLAVFDSGIDDGVFEVLIALVALLIVATINIRGVTARRLRTVLRVALASIVVLVAISVIAFAQFFDAGAIVDSVELGSVPKWENAIFALGVSCVALIGVEAASGLAGEVRVGRRGLRRVVIVSSTVALLLFVVVSSAALMAQPVQGGATPLGGRFIEAPILGIVSAYDSAWLVDAGRYVVAVTAVAMLLVAINSQMLGLARLAYSLATNRQIPSAVGRLSALRGTPYVAIVIATVIAFGLAIPHDLEFLVGTFAFGAMIAFAIAHLSLIVLRFREPARPSAFRVPFNVRVRGALGAAAGGVRARPRGRHVDQRRGAPRGGAHRRQRVDGRRDRALRRLPALRRQAAAAALHDPSRGAAGARRRPSTGASSCPCSARSWTTRSWAPRAGSQPSRTRTAGEEPCSRRCTCSRSRCRSRSTHASPRSGCARRRRCSRARRRSARSTRASRWPPRWCAAAPWARRSSRRRAAAAWRRSSSPPRSRPGCAAARSWAAAAGSATASSARRPAT